MKKFLLKNMGCKSNQLEGAIIRENLIKAGFVEANGFDDADLFILNSCTVTHKSDNETFRILNHAKNCNEKIVNILTGCVAQIEKEKLLEKSFVDYVLGNDEKLVVQNYINLNSNVSDIMELTTFHNAILNDTSKTRANLKIQDGCNNRCSYCIIPFARGKNRSADLDYILNQIKIFEQAGFKEIVLTGIHIGQWGYDFSNKKNLLYLLENIEEKTSISRYRLGSLNPLEIDDEMLNFLSKSQKFCPHFHLSLQSLCDKTLKAMNRHYSAQRSLELITKIDEMFNLPFLGSDIIAGFVGETERDFEQTISNLQKSKLSKIHTFPYSIRKGTVAEKLEGHLSDKVKSHRASVIKDISEEKYKNFLKRNNDTLHDVLIEKHRDKKTGYLKGITENYLPVLLNSNDNSIKRTIQKFKIQCLEEGIYGKLFPTN